MGKTTTDSWLSPKAHTAHTAKALRPMAHAAGEPHALKKPVVGPLKKPDSMHHFFASQREKMKKLRDMEVIHEMQEHTHTPQPVHKAVHLARKRAKLVKRQAVLAKRKASFVKLLRKNGYSAAKAKMAADKAMGGTDKQYGVAIDDALNPAVSLLSLSEHADSPYQAVERWRAALRARKAKKQHFKRLARRVVAARAAQVLEARAKLRRQEANAVRLLSQAHTIAASAARAQRNTRPDPQRLAAQAADDAIYEELP